MSIIKQDYGELSGGDFSRFEHYNYNSNLDMSSDGNFTFASRSGYVVTLLKPCTACERKNLQAQTIVQGNAGDTFNLAEGNMQHALVLYK